MKIYSFTLFLGGALLLANVCQAATLNFNGTFGQDDDIVQIPFSIGSNSTVVAQTTSFALGGFNPVLTLFDAAGNLIDQDTTGGTAPGGCASRGIDPVSTFCLDALINTVLNAGNYILVVTEWDNLAFGPTLADGFTNQGAGNFTGPNFTGNPGSFILFNGTQRSADWALQIDSNDIVTPEPQSFAMVASAIGALGWMRFKRRKS